MDTEEKERRVRALAEARLKTAGLLGMQHAEAVRRRLEKEREKFQAEKELGVKAEKQP